MAALATIVATLLGTLMALALVRYQFRGRSATNLFIFIPLATPEVVLGARCCRCSSRSASRAGS